jgi:hypothetical protein
MPKGALRIVAATVAVMAGYLGVLVVNGPRNADEALPFFNWSLFSRVPAREGTHYSIRLVEVDGSELDEPVYFDEASDIVSTSGLPEASTVMQDLGRAMEDGDEAAVDAARERLESRFLAELDSATYEVVRRRFDIVERLDCSCYLEETVLGELSFG